MINGQVRMKIEPTFAVFDVPTSDYKVYACNLIEILQGEVTFNKYGNISLVGTMPKLDLYKTYSVSCKEIYNKKFGVQYELISIETQKPSTSEEQRLYLSTFLTPFQVENIMKVYEYPVDAILTGEFDYNKVYGFGPHYYKILKQKVTENFVLFELLAELGKYNITYKTIKKIYDTYRNSKVALEKIKENPYILYLDVDGIGFLKADTIAQSMGITGIDKRRITAAIYYCLEQNQQDGNTWINFEDLFKQTRKLIKDNLSVEEVINCIDDDRFVRIDNKIGLKSAYKAEEEIKEHLLRLQRSEVKKLNIDVEKFIEKQEEKQGFKYDEKQKKIFYNVLNNNVNILTGYAGVGKTALMNGLLNMFDELNLSVVQFTYSGKAAQVLEEVTGRSASTIHRGLGWTPHGFKFNEKNKMYVDVVVVDEASMVDIFLFRDLLKALPDSCRLILVGDPGQLESINPGNILFDMIDSNLFSTVQLTKVFRQALESGILDLATRVRSGKKIVGNYAEGSYEFGVKNDAYLICENKENTTNNIIKSYKSLLKKYSYEDIIVLVPTKKSKCGTREFNKFLQELVNPAQEGKKEIEYGKDKRIFREGDLVINIENNYEVNWFNENFEFTCVGYVYNGEIGKIKKINENKDEFELYVEFKDRIIRYDWENLFCLEHAYALTIHKYQGSQSKVVIMGLDTRHWYQLKRSLLYTGITRAQELLVICADPKAINRAIEVNPLPKKRTFLKSLLLLC